MRLGTYAVFVEDSSDDDRPVLSCVRCDGAVYLQGRQFCVRAEAGVVEPTAEPLPYAVAKQSRSRLWGASKSAQMVFDESDAVTPDAPRAQSFDVTYPDGSAVVVARNITGDVEDSTSVEELDAEAIVTDETFTDEDAEPRNVDDGGTQMLGALVFAPDAQNVDTTKIASDAVFVARRVPAIEGIASIGSTKPEDATTADPNTAYPNTAVVLTDGELEAIIGLVSRRHEKIDPALLTAVILSESNGNPSAVSSKGAMGLMQLMPATATKHRVADAFDPLDNVIGGAAELAELIATYQDVGMALAAYNAGEGAVARHGGVPPYDETRDYVLKVLSKAYVLRRDGTNVGLTRKRQTALIAPNLDGTQDDNPEQDAETARIERKMGIFEYE